MKTTFVPVKTFLVYSPVDFTDSCPDSKFESHTFCTWTKATNISRCLRERCHKNNQTTEYISHYQKLRLNKTSAFKQNKHQNVNVHGINSWKNYLRWLTFLVTFGFCATTRLNRKIKLKSVGTYINRRHKNKHVHKRFYKNNTSTDDMVYGGYVSNYQIV